MSEHPPALPHAPLQEIADGVYSVRGSVRITGLIRIMRNMVVVRDGDDLTVISAVRLSPEGEAELEKLGKVRHVVKIGAFHGMDDAYYLERFGAAYWALPGGARKHDPKPDHELGEGSLPFPDAELFAFQKTVQKEAALLVRRAGGILVTCDAAQAWSDTRGCSVAAKVMIPLLGFTRRPAVIGPPWRKAMTPEGGTLREDFDRLASLEFAHMIGAHGGLLRDVAKRELTAAVAATFG